MLLGKKEFISEMANRYEITKVEATTQYEAVFHMLYALISENNDVSIPNFGKFAIRERAEHNGRNPLTGEAIVIPAKKTVAFKASKVLKESIE